MLPERAVRGRWCVCVCARAHGVCACPATAHKFPPDLPAPLFLPSYFPASGASTLALDTSHPTPWSTQGPLHACPLDYHSDAITSPTPPVPSLTHLGTPPAALSSRSGSSLPSLPPQPQTLPGHKVGTQDARVE